MSRGVFRIGARTKAATIHVKAIYRLGKKNRIDNISISGY